MKSNSNAPAGGWPARLTLPNGVEIELVVEDGLLRGLGAVAVGGAPIRSNATPIRPDFSTPDGLHYQDFRLTAVDKSADAIILKSEAIGRQELYGEMMDEYSYNLAFPTLRSRRTDQLDWIIRPSGLELDGQKFSGFSLAFRFHSETVRTHRLTTIATWEIGARAAGNTIYHQAYSCPPVTEITRDNHFSTSCLKRLDLWNHWLGHSFQMLPRWGCIQPFDFLSAAEGVLLGFWEEPHAVKSLVQKNPGEDVIFAVDEYDFPLTNSITTPAKHVVFSPSPGNAPRPKHEVVNLWTRAFDHTGEIIQPSPPISRLKLKCSRT